MSNPKKPEIVIIGGGAGGLELAIRLRRNFGTKNKFAITLVDESLKNIWKPLYHEVAVGTVDYAHDEINYISFTQQKKIRFLLGSLTNIDRINKKIVLAPVLDEDQHIIIPERVIAYDYLVIAIGSISNPFNIPGVAAHCLFLDKLIEAERFQKQFINNVLAFIQNNSDTPKSLNIAIVGGGATGVELAAELNYAFSRAITYGQKSEQLINKLKIVLLDGADRILPNLSPYISQKVTEQLQKMQVTVLTNERVVQATPEGLETASKKFIAADMMVWSAGIKAPDFLANLGLKTNLLNQILVQSSLQSVSDPAIFAIGDCAACPNPDFNNLVPPRAQAARQQAITLAKNLAHIIQGKPTLDFKYQDVGSLVSLSRKNVVGNLMGKTMGSFFIEGKMAQFSYFMLYKMHQATLYGLFKTFLLSLSNLFTRKLKSGIKLH